MTIEIPREKMKEFDIFVLVCDTKDVKEAMRNINSGRGNHYHLEDIRPEKRDNGMNKSSLERFVWYPESGWKLITNDPVEWKNSVEYCKQATEVTRAKHFKTWISQD